jgi:SAM-dependent methyltransferase
MQTWPGATTMKPTSTQQSESSVQKNISFFKENLAAYSGHVEALDTYKNIRGFTNQALAGVNRLLDVGNGGTFDYDVNLVRDLVAVDLFLKDLPPAAFPSHVQLKNGSALDLPEPDGSFDGILMSMLIHHLIGKTLAECRSNASRAIGEAFRVLKPGGKLVIVESCVPSWFYSFERIVFPVASGLIGMCIEHPATLQFTPLYITKLIEEHGAEAEVIPIPRGRWLLQYGFKFPSALTPVQPYRFVARRR